MAVDSAKNYLLIDEVGVCCRFNMTIRGRDTSVLHQMEFTPGLNGHNTQIINDSYTTLYHDAFFDGMYNSASLSWPDIRSIVMNFTDNVTVFCDFNNSAQPHNLSDVNFSIIPETEYVRSWLGDRYISMTATVLLTIIYSLILLSGVSGNVCTCIVIAKNRSLHTATNYYLFSLAVSDVMTLLLGKLLTSI